MKNSILLAAILFVGHLALADSFACSEPTSVDGQVLTGHPRYSVTNTNLSGGPRPPELFQLVGNEFKSIGIMTLIQQNSRTEFGQVVTEDIYRLGNFTWDFDGINGKNTLTVISNGISYQANCPFVQE